VPRAFDKEAFVASCHDALAETDVVAAVTETVQRVLVECGESIGTSDETLHRSPILTVQRLRWGSGALTDPHEHRLWAVVGVYRGEEQNRFYERGPTGLRPTGERVVARGDVLSLAPDVIHSAASIGSDWLGGLHVYGGDLFAVERSAWDPAGQEHPYEAVASQRRRMVQCIDRVAGAAERRLTPDDRRTAMLALWSASDRAGHHLNDVEASRVIRDALGVTT
jgi:predicted metal-dependent enzyme (double-stranded beta helix superfamily)